MFVFFPNGQTYCLTQFEVQTVWNLHVRLCGMVVVWSSWSGFPGPGKPEVCLRMWSCDCLVNYRWCTLPSLTDYCFGLPLNLEVK